MSCKALIVVDVQNDFCTGGGLAVEKGEFVVPVINMLMDDYDIVAATQDWHPADHKSFASSHEEASPYDIIDLNGTQQVLWPDHCIQGTHGADFHTDLHTEGFNLIIRKGTNPELDSYSGFFENDGKTQTGLAGALKELGVTEVHVCGLATDYCVFFTAMDAAKLGFKTSVIKRASKGVGFPEGSIEKALEEMKNAGIDII